MNEILFFKVFRNKYLNFKIFEYLNSNEIYNRFNNIEATVAAAQVSTFSNTNEKFSEERIIKFKYIYNFNWMIKNKQYQLLKCKLLNNEYIEFEINKETCDNLISISISLSSINETNLKEEIFKLLYKRFEIKIKKLDTQFNLIDDLLKGSYSIQNIELFLKENQKSNKELINILKISNSIKRNQNQQGGGGFFENLIKQQQHQQQHQQQQQQQQQQPIDHHQDSDKNYKELFKEFIFLSNDLNGIYCRDNYEFYLSKYDDAINEIMVINPERSTTVLYCIENFSLNVMKYLNFEMIYKYSKKLFSFPLFNREGKNNNNSIESIIEFLKLYLSIIIKSNQSEDEMISISSFEMEKLTIQVIINVMFRIDNSKLYETVLNQVIPLKYRVYLPSSYNSIQNQFQYKNELIIIKDTKTIDWLKECIKKYQNKYTNNFKEYLNGERFVFESFELAQYANQTIENISYYLGYKSTIYDFPLAKAIKECDLKAIKSIDSLNQGFIINAIISFLNNKPLSNINFKNSTIEEYNELFYYFANRYPIQHYDKSFIEYIVENGYYGDDDNKEKEEKEENKILFFNLSKIKIKNFNISEFYEFKSIKLERFIIENSTIISYDYYNPSSIRISSKNDNYYIELIQLYVVKLNKCKEDIKELKFYTGILNRLFQLFLINCNFNFNQINSIYQLFNENSIQININIIFLDLLKSRFPILITFGNIGSDSLMSILTSYEIVMNISYDEILQILVSIDFEKNKKYSYNTNYYNYLLNRNCIIFLKSNRLDLFFNQLNSINRMIELESCLIKLICKSFDNCDSLNSFFKLTKSYSYTNTNSVYYYIMATQLLKLNRIDLFDHLFNYLKFNDRKNIKFNRFDYSNNQLLQIFNSLVSIHKCVITFTINPIK